MDGEGTTERQYSEYSEKNSTQRQPYTIEIQTDTGENPPKSDGADETVDMSQILVWDIPRTVDRSGGRRMKNVEQKAD